ncbi:MAG TPA: cupin domain-containing protein [Gemmatimonadaceae bacterium]|nr:cupin domain-containing protein [Gemmatimonadaceae bacterium]
MKVQRIPDLAAAAVAANPSRPATMVGHDTADARVVLFRIEPGQAVAVHTNPSTVLLSIVSGSGFVTGADGEEAVSAGDLVTYAPKEPHGMRATTTQLVIAAVISPRPGDRKADVQELTAKS